MADFFLWLFRERKFAPITIKGYRARLSSAFWQLSLWDVGSHHDIFDAGSLFQEHPVTHSLFPHETWPWSWPRSLCCWCHFRVMENAVFLLALATEARVSELCALSINPDFLQFRDDGFGWLMMDPAFLMKNQLPLVPQQPFVVWILPVSGRVIMLTCRTQPMLSGSTLSASQGWSWKGVVLD